MSDTAVAQEEILKLRKALNEAHENEKKLAIQGILKQLGGIRVNETLLRSTGIGQAVGRLRNHSDTEIAIQAKKVVHQWKKDVVASNSRKTGAASNAKSHSTTSSTHPQNESNGKAATQQRQVTDKASQPKSDLNNNTNSNTATTKNNSSKPESTPHIKNGNSSKEIPATSTTRTAASDNITIDTTGDEQRNRCATMIYNSLAFDSDSDSNLIAKRALAIEKIEFQKEGSVSTAYKARIRSLYLNLKVKNNTGLRYGIVEGDISIERFCSMTKEEMASDELKQQMSKMREENLFKVQGAGQVQAETDQFRCGRCKSRKCTYYQMQTRSADEPMTTFVTCTECNHRWKFC